LDSPRRRSRATLAWEIGGALVLKFCLLYLIWVAWFSRPMAEHMQMDDNAVARAVLASDPANPTGVIPDQTVPPSSRN
jgi:hypothetical protein